MLTVDVKQELFHNALAFLPQRQSNQQVKQQPHSEHTHKLCSVLHMAIQSQNNKSAEIILNYMAKTKWSDSNQFKDIFDKLIEYKGFKGYMEGLVIQTQRMSHKQTLRVCNPMNSRVVKMAASQSQYVDKQWFVKHMKEVTPESKQGKVSKSYPIKLMSMQVDWFV